MEIALTRGSTLSLLSAVLLVLCLVAMASVWLGLRRLRVERTRTREALPARVDAELEQAREQGRQEGEQAADALRRDARDKADEASAWALREREHTEQRAEAVQAELTQRQQDLERREQRMIEREERLDTERQRLADRGRALGETEQRVDRRMVELRDVEADRLEVLERAAAMSADDAKQELVRAVEYQAKREAALQAREVEARARREADSRARQIVTLAIQRLASEQTSESTVTVVQLPSDDMKGRVIGREGRNIRAFESVTGVNLIVDDTPGAVLLSCFDPARREVARLTLDALVADGRIHPHRIEEVYQRSQEQWEQRCVRGGEDALVEVGITEMHPELVRLLGRLAYRTSYGQNVLGHLLESARLAGMMASELGMDPALLRRCALLHDIGKALTHEVEGSHALIGADLARRHGESEDVVHAIEAHHNEVEPRTAEAVLTQAADAISGGRPGARRDSLEAYVRRLERLEEIASAQHGVEKVFAMQAGREIRIMVLPEVVDDLQAQVIARDVAKEVEDELSYPGQIRITVVRESRSTEYAR